MAEGREGRLEGVSALLPRLSRSEPHPYLPSNFSTPAQTFHITSTSSRSQTPTPANPSPLPTSDVAAAKAADAARKRADRDALLAAEEASLPSKPRGAGTKAAQKKTRGADPGAARSPRGIDAALGTLGTAEPGAAGATATLNASGIDDALDALAISGEGVGGGGAGGGGGGAGGGGGGAGGGQVDRHPERRFKAAYAAFEARRLEEMKEEKGLRRQQKVEQARREFEKSPENPFNQVSGRFNSTGRELREISEAERRKIEERLAAPGAAGAG